MATPPRRQDLIAKAKLLAFKLTDKSIDWDDVPLTPNYLTMQPGDPVVDDGFTEENTPFHFTGELFEIGADGKPKPISAETRAYMEALSDNLTGSMQRMIPVPSDWTEEETRLAAGLLESSLLKSGLTPAVFNEPDAGGLVVCETLFETDNPENRYVRLRTNVIGHIDALTQKEIGEGIEETMKQIDTGWKMSRAGGKTSFNKRVDITGHTPFLEQWMQAYAKAAGMESEIKPEIGRKMAQTHNDAENRRFATLLQEEGTPPIISVTISDKLANSMKQNGFELSSSPEIIR